MTIFFRLCSIILLMSSSVCLAQPTTDKYQLAITFEQQGDYRNAARLFQELYASNTGNIKYFQGVARSLSALQRHAELLPLIELELRKNKTLELLCLASVTSKKSNQHEKSQLFFEESFEILNKLNNDFEKDNAIRLIAQAQSDISEFENAIKTYIKGREILAQNNAIYADELSMLYVQVGNVKDGIKEIANVFKQQQQYGIIQGRISALLTNEEAQSIIENELTKYSSNDFSFSRVYVWFLRETKQLDKAYAQALLIDNTLGLQGRELLEFAEITLKDGLFDIAMKAYGNILDRGKNNPHFSQALYGYAKAMDQRLQSSKSSLDEAEVRLIINRYYDIIAQSPQGMLAADCLYRIAMLELTNTRNATEAKKLFLRIVQTYPQYQVSATAANQLADLHIMFNSLNEAIELSTKTAQQYQFSFPAETDKANFLRAEIMLFKGEIDSCKNILIGLAGKTESDIANDALELSLFLEQHKQFQAGLISWGKARFLERKKEYQESVNAYRELALQTKGTELGEQAEMRACMILRTFNPQESLSEAQKFILNYPESMYTDSMLFMMAEIMIEQHQNADAIAVLTDILVRFPTSQFVRKSRELIRSLRGDS